MSRPASHYAAYADELVRMGHDPHWVRHNGPALMARFEQDPEPFPLLPEPVPEPVWRSRYADLDD